MNTVEAYRIALGTAQFGLDYGVANTRGRVATGEVERILTLAGNAGIRTLDTAIAYGDSERVLGQFPLGNFEVVSKLPAHEEPCRDIAGWVNREVEGSLRRLGIERLDALLLHRPAQLLLAGTGDALYGALSGMREQGVVGRIGVSVYEPQELVSLLARYPMDMVQAPFNIFDRRLETSGWLSNLSAQRVDVHARSAFLQGLLLMDDAKRPQKFDRWQPLWQRWRRWLEDTEQSALSACLRFVLSESRIQRVLVGVDTAAQLSEILQALDGDLPALPDDLEAKDVALLNPSMWSGL